MDRGQRPGPSPWPSAYASPHHPHPCRVLQLFLSRSAQRGPHLSNGRLLQRLGLLLLLALAFLVVWTAGALERGSHAPLVARGHTPAGRHFYLCHHDHWDYIMVVGELLLLSLPHRGPPCCTCRGPLALALSPVPTSPGTPGTERGHRPAAELVLASLPLTPLQLRCCSCAGAASCATPPEPFPPPSMSHAT